MVILFLTLLENIVLNIISKMEQEINLLNFAILLLNRLMLILLLLALYRKRQSLAQVYKYLKYQ